MAGRWIKKESDSLVIAEKDVQDITRNLLQSVKETKSLDAKLLKDYKKRNLVRTGKLISFTVKKGSKFALEIPVEHTDLTSDMLADGV